MDGYGGDQIRAAERPHLQAGEPLMQRAADGLATVVTDLLDDPAVRPGDGPGSVLVLVGSGDNGGDALFAAARLAAAGRHVTVLRVGSRVHEAGLAAAREAGARLLDDPADGGPVPSAAGAADILRAATPSAGDRLAELAREAALDADLVLDGILGIGGGGPLRSPARDVVAALRELAREQRAPFVVAVDVPSGIDVDTGGIADDHVLHADVTVTFGGVKAGLLRGPAATLAGRIELVDVGIGAGLATVEPLVST
ncbi:NAD(P)H-hydrate epimerase [Curtobacterium sp. MCJR17_055]|uniref:NAD(P)H-hydrate epimerase n=1 Tax=unclassified Curtobacterium TaxID=257496 RepID=UPI000D995735|nr:MULTISPECIES: NAD(P)H-hydrate epimerase [unclassified Curtobacterium]PYY32872.1 NAD(P)H-hydrate epimerase [Curtobacterium sp. MCBD17_029]PYY52856.1 NAD(P)H-hydrate epimerase [Curtobacterium sp. MCJR17_055]PYY56093.1 NAD(P)H-hydrate epimerase [Curtobacterium sp. MCPF17_015]